MPPALGATACAATLTLALTGCGGSSPSADSAEPAGADQKVQVAASFYPLQWVTEQVAGEAAEVMSLTPPGAEPHDLELGPREVAAVGEANLVVYLSGFQPAVDEAVEQEAADSALDVTQAAQLVRTTSGTDPHFWLDPARLADVGDAVAGRLSRIDGAGSDSAGYRARAADLRARLEALDAEFRAGLSGCAGTDLVTSHTAFGYLAERYGMQQVGITGLTPDAEPSPQDLAKVAAHVRANDVHTIYYETLVSPDVADTVARETGAATAVLDPLEGLTGDSAGDDYVSVMRSNLATLRDGQPCQ